jgi:hypothetical protein
MKNQGKGCNLYTLVVLLMMMGVLSDEDLHHCYHLLLLLLLQPLRVPLSSSVSTKPSFERFAQLSKVGGGVHWRSGGPGGIHKAIAVFGKE